MAARGADERGRRSGSASRNAGVGARGTRKREAAAAQFRNFFPVRRQCEKSESRVGVSERRAMTMMTKKSEETETVRHVYS
jgi:hypothetical protein